MRLSGAFPPVRGGARSEQRQPEMSEMRYLMWVAGVACVMAFVSVFAEAVDAEPAAKIASKAPNRLPASAGEVVPGYDEKSDQLPPELEGASIEVGFSQDGEPEPHLLGVARGGTVNVYQLREAGLQISRGLASVPAEPAADLPSKKMAPGSFAKRFNQVVNVENFFTARQPKPKHRCTDKYVLRVRLGTKFRERRGCSNQSDDAFAGIAQNFFRDAFLAWSKAD